MFMIRWEIPSIRSLFAIICLLPCTSTKARCWFVFHVLPHWVSDTLLLLLFLSLSLPFVKVTGQSIIRLRLASCLILLCLCQSSSACLALSGMPCTALSEKMPVSDLLPEASWKKDWKRISAESFLLVPPTNQSVKGLNWTGTELALSLTPFLPA